MASARRRKDCFTSFLFVLPLLTLFLVFFAYPIIYNIVISFYDWNGISVEKVFVGFENYKKLWADSVMQKTFRNFVIIAISTTVIQSALGLMLASFFIRKIKLSGLYKILFLSTCNLYLHNCWYWFFSKIFETNRGYLNVILRGTSSGFPLSAVACNAKNCTCLSFICKYLAVDRLQHADVLHKYAEYSPGSL